MLSVGFDNLIMVESLGSRFFRTISPCTRLSASSPDSLQIRSFTSILQGMIKREYGAVLRRLLRRFPCVTLLGPRQCGKTTFIRAELPTWTYLDLERPSDAAPLVADPEARLQQLKGKVVLDEAQRVPELFPVLRGAIDRQRSKMGQFVILGSASPTLARHISESLAGRTAFVDLPPFRWSEVKNDRRATAVKALWLRGGFPQAFLNPNDRDRSEWLEAYTRTFIERDLPALGIDVSAAQMRKLWAMLAHCNAGVWNASQLAASLAVSYHTVNRYVDILEQTFLIRKLPPYFANVGKRLVRESQNIFSRHRFAAFFPWHLFGSHSRHPSRPGHELGSFYHRSTDFDLPAGGAELPALFLAHFTGIRNRSGHRFGKQEDSHRGQAAFGAEGPGRRSAESMHARPETYSRLSGPLGTSTLFSGQWRNGAPGRRDIDESTDIVQFMTAVGWLDALGRNPSF